MRDVQAHNTANEKKWSRRAITFDQKRYDIFRYLQWQLIRYVGLQAPCNFMDLGCGTGWAVRYAARCMEGRGRFVGVDISRGMIERARVQTDGISNIEFYESSAERLPLESDSFDTVICTNSFHHYLLPDKALSEIQRILRPNGRLFILDLTSDDFFTRWVNRRTSVREKEHVKYYSSDEYRDMFDRAGLRHVHSGPLLI